MVTSQSKPQMPTRVLLTNDDGVDAPGMQTLRACAETVFEHVTVVAPDGDRSGTSASITLHRPLRIESRTRGVYAIDGTPVDSVIMGVGHVMHAAPPEIVLSGVNRGPNLGNDVYYSGTVAAARQAITQGIPAIALSLAGLGNYPFEAVSPP